MATSGARQAQQINTIYVKNKMLPNPIVCIMEEGLSTTGWAAEEARADEKSGIDSESDGATDSQTGWSAQILQQEEKVDHYWQELWCPEDRGEKYILVNHCCGEFWRWEQGTVH